MSKNINYVILGAGQLGLAIMDELVAKGHEVTIANRSTKLNEKLPKSVKLIQFDASDPDQVERVSKDAHIVFFCVQPPYHLWPALFPKLTASVLEGVSRTNAKLVFGSNVYLYGDPNGALIHEGLPAAAKTIKGAVRAKMAKMLLDAHATGKVEVVIGRGSDFFGPRVRNSAMGDRLFQAALEGKTADLLGDVNLPHTYTYIRDFARALITLSQQDEAYGRAWHVPNAPTGTTQDFIDLIEAELGHPVKVRASGALMVRLLGLFNPVIRELHELMYEFQKPFVVDHSQFVAQFGNDVTPHKQAIQETVEWYRQYAR
ncbi:MAG: NAD-dependent epimerase/dehydratase family protein [Anaerolineae bacterium]